MALAKDFEATSREMTDHLLEGLEVTNPEMIAHLLADRQGMDSLATTSCLAQRVLRHQSLLHPQCY